MPVEGAHMEGLRSVLEERSREWSRFRATHPERSLALGDVTWRYLIGGDGPDTVLFLPGGLRFADPFFVILTALEHEHRVIAPSYPPLPTMAALLSGIGAILDVEGVRRVHVLGESFGGELAQCVVRQYPDRVDRLILANTAPPHHLLAWPLAGVMRMLALAPTPALRALGRRLLFRFLSAPPAEEAFWRGVIEDIMFRRFTRADLMSFFAETLDFHAHYRFASQDLARWPGRVLIVESRDDRAVPPASREALRQLYPSAAVRTFDRGGHTPWLTEPGAYFSAVRTFLAGRDTRKSEQRVTPAHRG